jgi:hypothetical protein
VVIISDKTWVYGYGPDTKQQTLQGVSGITVPKEGQTSSFQCEESVTAFFDSTVNFKSVIVQYHK